MTFRRFLFGLIIAAVAVVLALKTLPGTKPSALTARSGPQLQAAKVWGYQLQGARAELIAPEIDLLVIDHARDTSATDHLSAADVAAFRNRGNAPSRIVLGYMSIGEAERYRYYWRPWWSKRAYMGLFRPAWLARENKEWKGNYLVRFWERGWQKVIFNPAPTLFETLAQRWFGAPQSYIDMLINAGFDGVYLDRVDVFGEWEKSRPGAEAEMSAFVQALSAYAKARKPGFLIVPQNGEELAARADYRASIDGIAKEDLLFGVEKAETANSRDETRRSIELLRKVQAEGKPVFVVEYLRDGNKRAVARARTAQLGFAVTFAERELNRPPEVAPPPAAVAAPAIPSKNPPPAIPKTQP